MDCCRTLQLRTTMTQSRSRQVSASNFASNRPSRKCISIQIGYQNAALLIAFAMSNPLRLRILPNPAPASDLRSVDPRTPQGNLNLQMLFEPLSLAHTSTSSLHAYRCSCLAPHEALFHCCCLCSPHTHATWRVQVLGSCIACFTYLRCVERSIGPFSIRRCGLCVTVPLRRSVGHRSAPPLNMDLNLDQSGPCTRSINSIRTRQAYTRTPSNFVRSTIVNFDSRTSLPSGNAFKSTSSAPSRQRCRLECPSLTSSDLPFNRLSLTHSHTHQISTGPHFMSYLHTNATKAQKLPHVVNWTKSHGFSCSSSRRASCAEWFGIISLQCLLFASVLSYDVVQLHPLTITRGICNKTCRAIPSTVSPFR